MCFAGLEMQYSWFCESDVLLLFIFLFWHVVSHNDLMDPVIIGRLKENAKCWTTSCQHSRTTKRTEFHILCFVQTNPSPGMETSQMATTAYLQDVHLPFSWTEARPGLIKTRGLTVWSKGKRRWLFGSRGLFLLCPWFACDLVRSRANRAAWAHASQNLALMLTVQANILARHDVQRYSLFYLLTLSTQPPHPETVWITS
jgi:hypothetical protein